MIFYTTYLMHKRKTYKSGMFMLFSVSVVLYLFGYMMELNSTSFRQMLFWNIIQYLGIPFTSLFWLIFSLQYVKKYNRLKTWVKALLFVIPVGTVIMRFTNRFHYLFYIGYEFIQNELFPVLYLEKGPWYYVQTLYTILCISTIVYLYISRYKISPKVEKKGLKYMIAAVFPPVIGLMMNITLTRFLAIDYSALAIPISIFFMSIPVNIFVGQYNGVKRIKIPKVIDMVRQVANKKMLEKALLFNLQQHFSDSGKTYFDDAVKFISGMLDMDYVCICRLSEDGKTCQTMSIYGNNRYAENCETPFENTICGLGGDISKPVVSFRKDVYKIFPENKLVQEIKAHSYVRMSLSNNSGVLVGFITMISKSPKVNIRSVELIVRMIGIRVVGELEGIKAKQAVKESEEKYRLLVTRMHQSLVVCEFNERQNERPICRLIDVNPSFEKLTGLSKEEILNRDLYDILPDMKNCDTQHLIDAVVHGNNVKTELFFPSFDKFYEIILYSPKANQMAAIFSNITSRKKREAEMLYKSNHDSITGLYNRALFEAEKKRINTAAQLPLSIIIGDVNGLKLTNDIFGHDEGDKLLVVIANILKRNCRKGDIVARIGGDEFGILMPLTDGATARMICKKVYDEVNEYMNDSDQTSIYPGISLGYAVKTKEEESIEKTVRNAEANMYKKKLIDKKKNNALLMSSIKNIMLERTIEPKEHIDRLIELSAKFGEVLKLPRESKDALELVAVFHDIGKMNIDDNILSKKGQLTEQELTELKKYPEAGYRIALATPELYPVADYILCSHERWDGKGYPQGLTGENIPLLSRIFAVINAYEAMTQDRPYRKALSKKDALDEIKSLSGTWYDPNIANAFFDMMSNTGG